MNNVNNNQVPVDYPTLYAEMQEIQGRNWWFKVHYPAILDLIRSYLRSGMTVLDLGSAAGWSTRDLPDELARILLDIRPLALLKSVGDSRGRICADAHNIPLRNACCDVVICEGLLHQGEAHTPRRIVAEAVRVCRPGGVIISVEPAFQCLFGSHDAVYGGHRRFRLSGLRELFSDLPVRFLRGTYLHMFVFFPAWTVRHFFHRTKTDLTLGNNITNRICIWLGTVERWLTRRLFMPLGITAAVLFRREEDADG